MLKNCVTHFKPYSPPSLYLFTLNFPFLHPLAFLPTSLCVLAIKVESLVMLMRQSLSTDAFLFLTPEPPKRALLAGYSQ